jgi:hypothetical protein
MTLQFDLMAVHKCFLQGPLRDRDLEVVAYGAPGLPMQDFYCIRLVYGLAVPSKSAGLGFHTAHAPSLKGYQAALETLNNEKDFFKKGNQHRILQQELRAL